MSKNITAVAKRASEKRKKEAYQRNRDHICEHVLHPEATEHLQKAIWSAAHEGQFRIMILRVRYHGLPVRQSVHGSVWNGLRVPRSNRWPLCMLRVNRVHEQLDAIVESPDRMRVFEQVLIEKTCIDGVGYEWKLEDVAGCDCKTLYAAWK